MFSDSLRIENFHTRIAVGSNKIEANVTQKNQANGLHQPIVYQLNRMQKYQLVWN